MDGNPYVAQSPALTKSLCVPHRGHNTPGAPARRLQIAYNWLLNALTQEVGPARDSRFTDAFAVLSVRFFSPERPLTSDRNVPDGSKAASRRNPT